MQHTTHTDAVELDTCTVLITVATLFSCSMGDGEGSKNSSGRRVGVANLSLDISSNRSSSRDLLRRFTGTSSEFDDATKEEDEEEIELNLGLSLGGRFGIDKNKLGRSSSIASCLPVVRDDNDVGATAPVAYTSLVRTSSLPVETEEEWRKRKELQTLRRMEAKRRRSEKQRNFKGGDRESGGSGSGNLSLEEKKEIEMNLRGRLDREKSISALRRTGSAQLGMPTWVAAAAVANQAIVRSGIDAAMAKGKGSFVRQPASRGSVESKGGSSSSVSDFETKTPQDNVHSNHHSLLNNASNLLSGSSGEISPGSIQSLQEGANPDTRTKATAPDIDGSTRASMTRAREIGTNSMEEMPCVFTKGDGPHGRRVDGILYRYGKGEEVRIMCVCHGSFHSPVEFVKHAGGTDTDNPLKHIVVNPNASPML